MLYRRAAPVRARHGGFQTKRKTPSKRLRDVRATSTTDGTSATHRSPPVSSRHHRFLSIAEEDGRRPSSCPAQSDNSTRSAAAVATPWFLPSGPPVERHGTYAIRRRHPASRRTSCMRSRVLDALRLCALITDANFGISVCQYSSDRKTYRTHVAWTDQIVLEQNQSRSAKEFLL